MVRKNQLWGLWGCADQGWTPDTLEEGCPWPEELGAGRSPDALCQRPERSSLLAVDRMLCSLPEKVSLPWWPRPAVWRTRSRKNSFHLVSSG